LLADAEDYIAEFVIKQSNPEVQSVSSTTSGIRRVDMILADALKQRPLSYLEKIIPSIHDDSVIIFTNIYRNASTRQSWEQLKLNQQVRATIDLYFIGMVFFKPGMSKEDFKVRY
jgi:predicted O-methyltransferase YrrM